MKTSKLEAECIQHQEANRCHTTSTPVFPEIWLHLPINLHPPPPLYLLGAGVIGILLLVNKNTRDRNRTPGDVS